MLGVWIMIFLFLGVPSLWHKIFAVVSGLAVIGISYTFPPQNSRPFSGKPEAFAENNSEDKKE